VALAFDHDGIAGQLCEVSDFAPDPPDKRVKPEDALGPSGERGDQGIATAQVREFMDEHRAPRAGTPAAPILRQDHSGMEHANGHWREDVRRFPKARSAERRGSQEDAPQKHPSYEAVADHCEKSGGVAAEQDRID
jgi:hypothetical protein